MPSLEVIPEHAGPDLSRPGAFPRSDIEGLYVHVPFCFHKCHYCDFYSITRQSPERMDAFVDLIDRELALWTASHPLRPRSIFFGGGTPSLLPRDTMRALLERIRARGDLSALREWTVEVNPATTDLTYLEMMRSLGVNRISMGAQSFDERELAMLERHHVPADVERSVEWCRAAGFERINIDLIYAIPGQTPDSWRRSLDRAIELGLTHYSCYNLTYEPNTPMAVKQRLGRIREVEESVELEMLHTARLRLTSIGCAPYEISNYAAPGEECLHNLCYWRGGSYLGIGPSAASHLEGVRFKNRGHLGEWERAIRAESLPIAEVERLTSRQRQGEFIMLGLRLAGGVDAVAFSEKFGIGLEDAFAPVIDRLTSLGLITAGRSLRLTDNGLPVADAVAAEFL